MLSKNLQKFAGQNIKKMLTKMTENKLAGIGIGASAGVILESSSATTVIILGLVNAGIINLLQATLIIMGANIGTTFSVVVFSLNYLPIGELFAFFSLIGTSLIIGGKSAKTKTLGYIFAGFGLIFIGLNIMSSSVDFLKESENFINLLGSLKNPFIILLLGALFSAITSSNSATTGLVITLAHAKILPLPTAFFIMLGSNIGMCMTAIFASLDANLNAKRTAFIQLLFNLIGVFIYMPFLMLYGIDITNALKNSFSPSVIIASFHVIFNLTTTIILIPFVKNLTKLAIFILPEKVAAK